MCRFPPRPSWSDLCHEIKPRQSVLPRSIKLEGFHYSIPTSKNKSSNAGLKGEVMYGKNLPGMLFLVAVFSNGAR
jgi:hypothetical protein